MPGKAAYDVSARYVELSVTTAAKLLTKSTVWNIAPFTLVELQVLYPAGHVGLTGFRLQSQGTAIVPWNQPTITLVGNDERRIFEVNFDVVHPLTLITANGDNIPHTLYFVAKLRDIVLAGDTPPLPDLSRTPITL